MQVLTIAGSVRFLILALPFLNGESVTMTFICPLEYVDMGDEIICVPVGVGANKIHGVIKLNSSAKEIVSLLAEVSSVERAVQMLALRYESDSDTLTNYVSDVIHTLKEIGLIEE